VAAPADLVAVRLARAAAEAHRVWAAAAWEAAAGAVAVASVAAVAVAAVVDAAAVVVAADAAGKRGVKGEQR